LEWDPMKEGGFIAKLTQIIALLNRIKKYDLMKLKKDEPFTNRGVKR